MTAVGTVTTQAHPGHRPDPQLVVWRGAAVRVLSTLVIRGAALITTIVVVRTLPSADAGVFFLAIASATVLGPVLSLGVVESVSRRVARMDGSAAGGGLARRGLRTILIGAGVAIGSGAILTAILAPSEAAPILVAPILGSLFAVQSLGGAFLRARSRIWLAEAIQTLSPIAFLLVLLTIIPRAPSSGPALLARSGVELLAAVFVVSIILRGTRGCPSGPSTRSILSGSMPFWMMGLAWLALQNADVLILGWLEGSEIVAGYVPVLRLADLSVLALGLFGAYVLPMCSKLLGQGRGDQVEALYVHASAFALALSAPVIATLLVAPRETVELLFGSSFHEAPIVARILAAAYAVNAALGLNGVVLQAIGDVRVLARVAVGVLLATLVADLLLISMFGVPGAALGTLVAFASLNGAATALLMRGHGISPFKRGLMLPAGVAGAVTASLWVVGAGRLGATGVVVIAATVGVGALVAAWAGADREMRWQILRALGARR